MGKKGGEFQCALHCFNAFSEYIQLLKLKSEKWLLDINEYPGDFIEPIKKASIHIELLGNDKI